jgi:Amt family ammonium transporter
MRFAGYVLTAFVIAGFIYPVVGHWAWAGADQGQSVGWLGAMGFIDFAGSTVVHSVGGWVALSALLIIGPRTGRFTPEPRDIEGHSLPMAALGVFLLWFGWFGFNGGSTLGIDNRIPLIIANTALAAAAGGIAGMSLTWWHKGLPQVKGIMNGVIAGLVSITAACHLVTPLESIIIGGIGGMIANYASWILERWQVDDAIDAVPAHLVAGIWGTLVVALFPEEGAWGTGLGRWDQFMVQLEGVVVIGAYAFSISYALLYLINKRFSLRVSPQDELIGLNVAEHGASTALLDLVAQMDQQARRSEFSSPVEVEEGTEASRIAVFYNAVLEKFNIETDRRHMAMRKLEQLASYDSLTGLANRRLFFSAAKRAVAHAIRKQLTTAVLYFDLDGFKAVNDQYGHDVGDKLLKAATTRMAEAVREMDMLARLGGDEFALLLEDVGTTEGAETVARKIIASISQPFELGDIIANIGVSIGIALTTAENRVHAKTLVRNADHAMYAAKMAGKGRLRFYSEELEELVVN